MKNSAKYIIIGLTTILIIIAMRFFLGGLEDAWVCEKGVWVRRGNPNAPVPTTPCAIQAGGGDEIKGEITYKNATKDLIEVALPFPGAVTGKEFSVIGKARGYWFFEASFPIQVFDKDGKLLATAIAQAQDEWMTTEFVPFRADVKVPQSYIGPATLVLNKDNPSGLPENEASISFPFTIEY